MGWTTRSRAELSTVVVMWWATHPEYRPHLTAPNILRARVLSEAALDAMHGLPFPTPSDLFSLDTEEE